MKTQFEFKQYVYNKFQTLIIVKQSMVNSQQIPLIDVDTHPLSLTVTSI